MTFPSPATYLEHHPDLLYPWRGREFHVFRDDGHIRIQIGHEYKLADITITWERLEEEIQNYREGAWCIWTHQL